MKTYNLTGSGLDWAVHTAQFEGCCIEIEVWPKAGELASRRIVLREAGEIICPSTDWAQGGPIIDLHRICIDIGHAGVWLAYSKQNYADDKEYMHSGDTPLVAAMRCYVASKLGVEVDIPAELMPSIKAA
jgi:hypothetical protein